MSVNRVNTDGSLSRIAGGTLYADAPIGEIHAFGGTSIPSGYLLCDGTAYSRTDYAELFAVIGTAFGSGDGSTTFNLPDLREATTKGVGLSGKSSNHMDADGLALGEFIDDRLQDLQIKSSENISELSDWADDTVKRGYVGNTLQVRNLHNMSPGNTTNRFGATTEVKAVGVNYIIKAKQVALPLDIQQGVEEMIGDKLSIVTRNIESQSISANGFIPFNFPNPHPDWTLLGAFVMSTGNQDAGRQWGNVRTDQINTIYGSIMSQIAQTISGKVVLIYLKP